MHIRAHLPPLFYWLKAPRRFQRNWGRWLRWAAGKKRGFCPLGKPLGRRFWAVALGSGGQEAWVLPAGQARWGGAFSVALAGRKL